MMVAVCRGFVGVRAYSVSSITARLAAVAHDPPVNVYSSAALRSRGLFIFLPGVSTLKSWERNKRTYIYLLTTEVGLVAGESTDFFKATDEGTEYNAHGDAERKRDWER